MLAISRPDDRPPLAVVAAPLGGRTGRWAAAALFVRDPERITPPSPAALRRLYPLLTQAEAHIALAVLEEQRLADVAEHHKPRKLSLSTVRAQLGEVFDKTGTRRQCELARLLFRLLPPLRPHRP